jgi:hypothetical protein
MLTCNLINERYNQFKNNLYGKKVDNELLTKIFIDYFNDDKDCINQSYCQSEVTCSNTIITCAISLSQQGLDDCATLTITQL